MLSVYRSKNKCSPTTSAWLSCWRTGSSRRKPGCQKSSVMRQRLAWQCSRRVCASIWRAAPQRTETRSSRLVCLCRPFCPTEHLCVGLLVTHSLPTRVAVQFSQQEQKRQKAERQHQQQKHENQLKEMMGQCESNIRELQQLQVDNFSLSSDCFFFFMQIFWDL